MTVLTTDHTRRTNGRCIADAARLGFLPEPVVDPTYGRGGGMWTEYRPEQLLAFDLDPACGVTVAELGALPLGDEVAGSLVLDPPYKLTGTPTTVGADGGMNRRFGVDRYRSPADVHELYRLGMTEAARVVRRGGYVLVKCMDQTAGGQLHLQSKWCADIAAGLPLFLIGRLNVGHTPRAQRSQATPANNHSTMLVFRRRTRPAKVVGR